MLSFMQRTNGLTGVGSRLAISRAGLNALAESNNQTSTPGRGRVHDDDVKYQESMDVKNHESTSP